MNIDTAESSPILEVLRAELDALPNAKKGQRNTRHLIAPDGSIHIKSAPWIDPASGETVSDEPEWIKLFPRTSVVEKADFVMNLENPVEGAKVGFRDVQNFRNPLTGEIVPKLRPWVDDEGLILEEYKAGLEVSRGKKIKYKHNPAKEFDDPSDSDNLRFIWSTDVNRAIGMALPETALYKPGWNREGGRHPRKDTIVIGANLGGTIMMKKKQAGLAPGRDMGFTFDDHLASSFPTCALRSFGLPKTKLSRDSEASYGIDSSQIEIDFIADLAIALTHTWNNLKPDEKMDFAGFVVAIGSDTSVEAVSILKMMLGPNCPFSVIAVAAMKPIGEESSEGLANYHKAVEHLIALHQAGLTAVALRAEGGLYDPTKTIKKSDKIAAAFRGAKLIDTEYFETVDSVNPDRFYRIKEEDYESEYTEVLAFRGSSAVKSIESQVSIDTFDLEKEVRDSSSAAILVEAYPSFTTAMNAQKAIVKGAEGRPIFYINQIPGGKIDHEYEVAKALMGQDIYPLSLTAHAARAKLNYAIQLFGDDKQKIIDFMTKNNFVGEQPDDFSPYPVSVVSSSELLRHSLFAAVGMTPEMYAKFESAEFQAEYPVAKLQMAIKRKMQKDAGQDLWITSMEEQINSDMYELYCLIKQWDINEMIAAINENLMGIRDSLKEVQPTLVQNILEGSISTVKSSGNPIELEREL